jgi:hypothetical protein
MGYSKRGRRKMLSLSNIHYTIWEYNEEKEESSLVEAISIAGTRDDACP